MIEQPYGPFDCSDRHSQIRYCSVASARRGQPVSNPQRSPCAALPVDFVEAGRCPPYTAMTGLPWSQREPRKHHLPVAAPLT